MRGRWPEILIIALAVAVALVFVVGLPVLIWR